jgi:hypothetical protein
MALAFRRHAKGKTNLSEMIPREILKKIRQIEIRTNRVVTGLSARGQSRRTGVAPVSNFKTTALAESAAAAIPRLQTAGKILEDGDRRDACPTTRICTSRSLHSALV